MALVAFPAPPALRDNLVEDFLVGLSRATSDCYRRDLCHVASWLAGRGASLISASRVDLARYVRAQEDTGVAPTTIRRRCAALSGYYRYLVGEGALERSPAARLRRPKGDGAVRLGLDVRELRLLLEAAGDSGGCAELLVTLLFFCGLRVSEAVRLDDTDVSSHEGRMLLTVTRKGGGTELVGTSDRVATLVENAISAQGGGPLLRSRRGARLSREGAWWMVRRLGETAGIRAVHPHLLRHSFVTQALVAGVGLPVVAIGAGHRDVRSTLIYARGLEAVYAEAGEAVAGVVGCVDP
ncbi:MAG: tyrosine-type recombinase/integrase [Acidimicrobiales bacterium]